MVTYNNDFFFSFTLFPQNSWVFRGVWTLYRSVIYIFIYSFTDENVPFMRRLQISTEEQFLCLRNKKPLYGGEGNLSCRHYDNL